MEGGPKIIGGNEEERRIAKERLQQFSSNSTLFHGAEIPMGQQEGEFINAVLMAFPHFLKRYGLKPSQKVTLDNVRFLDRKKLTVAESVLIGSGSRGFYDRQANQINLFSETKREMVFLLTVFCHEYFHSIAFRSHTAESTRDKDVLPRRFGFDTLVEDEAGDAHLYFDRINEAVTDKLSELFL